MTCTYFKSIYIRIFWHANAISELIFDKVEFRMGQKIKEVESLAFLVRVIPFLEKDPSHLIPIQGSIVFQNIVFHDVAISEAVAQVSIFDPQRGSFQLHVGKCLHVA